MFEIAIWFENDFPYLALTFPFLTSIIAYIKLIVCLYFVSLIIIFRYLEVFLSHGVASKKVLYSECPLLGYCACNSTTWLLVCTNIMCSKLKIKKLYYLVAKFESLKTEWDF